MTPRVVFRLPANGLIKCPGSSVGEGTVHTMSDQVLDETLLAKLKEDLMQKRGEILAASTGTRPLPASMDVNSRQGDLADQASGNNEVHIQLKLKQTDAKILQAVEEALYRMEKGTYGICRDCEIGRAHV